VNPKEDFYLLGNINKGYTKMPEPDTIYLPITEEDGYALQKIITNEITKAKALNFTETLAMLTRINLALQHGLSIALEKGDTEAQD
jgi:hypothetical protein